MICAIYLELCRNTLSLKQLNYAGNMVAMINIDENFFRKFHITVLNDMIEFVSNTS